MLTFLLTAGLLVSTVVNALLAGLLLRGGLSMAIPIELAEALNALNVSINSLTDRVQALEAAQAGAVTADDVREVVGSLTTAKALIDGLAVGKPA